MVNPSPKNRSRQPSNKGSTSLLSPLALKDPAGRPPTVQGRTIIARTIPSAFYANDLILDKSSGNWIEWRTWILRSLATCGLAGYLKGAAKAPDEDGDPFNYSTWYSNDRMARSFLALKSGPWERKFFEDHETRDSTAAVTWTALCHCHNNEGAYAQLLLLKEFFSFRFVRGESYLDLAHRMANFCEHIFKIGLPTEDALLCLGLLHTMSGDLEHLQSQISTAMSNPSSLLTLPPTLSIVWNSNTKSPLVPFWVLPLFLLVPLLLLRQLNRLLPSPAPTPGGKMEGKRDEVLARKRLARDQKHNKPYSSSTFKDPAGRTFFVDSDGSAHYLATSPPPTSSLEIVTLATTSPSWLADHANGNDSVLSAVASSPQSTLLPPSFFFDSGASTHLTPCRSDFVSFCSIPPRGIRGMNGSVIYALGIGRVSLSLPTGSTLALDDVLFVPQATVCLLSISALCSSPSQYCVVFDHTGVRVSLPSGSLIASGPITPSRLYALSRLPTLDHTFLAVRRPSLVTWHHRLGHTNYRTLFDMSSAGLLPGMPIDFSAAPPKCDSCLLGKQTRSAVPKVREGVRSSEQLGLVYVDLMGPANVKSLSGNLYALHIIDDFTSYSWSIPLPSKDAALRLFTSWATARMTETNLPLRAVQIDNGELLSAAFRAFLSDRGIQLWRTAAYTSAQNGRIERLHRTLMNRARAMRASCNLPAFLWDELLCAANYLTVRALTCALHPITTPFEAWHSCRPDLSILREIGCHAFVLIQNHHNPKIYDRSLECVLIGYSLDSKAFRCYHPGSRKVVESFHVSFIESFESDVPPAVPAAEVISPTPSSVASFTPPVTPIPPPLVPVALPSPVPPPLRRSSRVPVPSERRVAALDLPYSSAISRAVEASAAAGSRLHTARTSHLPPLHPPAPSDPLAALLSSLADVPPALTLDVEYPGDPSTLAEAMASPFASQWRTALLDEFQSIRDLHVYELVPRSSVPSGHRIMRGHPVFHLKRDHLNVPVRFKAHWVCQGFVAIFGQDYTRTSSPTVRMESFCALLHLAAARNWEIHHIDVKTAFLYGLLPDNETCYMEQPHGFEDPDHPDWVWKLLKGLYGMKQGGRTWNCTMHIRLLALRFVRLPCEYCIYYCQSDLGTIVTCVHVNDFLMTVSR
ncbi:uncharacterized protein FIBRA_09127 [Fibroporia radiculosa]|uniref:Integrase catalytic domain-containing protein n=1 Tax=Fibroporia radiculosa TaxID=599839 RepID=J4H5J0_9APHY|nr:uncharacterized protein FIBRA_09127 [Fibroporia radiculosa]CCM06824.1 predicted protein [Fibroporia radiculosa]